MSTNRAKIIVNDKVLDNQQHANAFMKLLLNIPIIQSYMNELKLLIIKAFQTYNEAEIRLMLSGVTFTFEIIEKDHKDNTCIFNTTVTNGEKTHIELNLIECSAMSQFKDSGLPESE